MSEHAGNGGSSVVVAPPRPEPGRHVSPPSVPPPLPLAIPEASSGHVDDRMAPARPVVTELLRPPIRRRVLRAGCYLLRYTPTPRATALVPLHYDGTLRVEIAADPATPFEGFHALLALESLRAGMSEEDRSRLHAS